jgi:phospholipase/lecithinase/hemolysin
MQKLIVRLFNALILVLFCATGIYAGVFDRIVVFGDSLSDDGNYILFPGQPAPDPDQYWEGRFSNGPVWNEYLARPQRLDAPLSNRAYGGAETSSEFPPGVREQVTFYVFTEDSPSPDTLFAVWIGGNDHLNSGRGAQAAVDNIEDALEALIRCGARHLLVLNLPDLGVIPDTLGTPDAAPATQFTLEFNAALGSLLDRLGQAHPSVALYEFDAYGLSVQVANDPQAFGFVNATEQSPNFGENFEPSDYVFWDDKHPTTRMHELLADRVFADLNGQIAQPSEESGSSDSGTCFIGALHGGR